MFIPNLELSKTIFTVEQLMKKSLIEQLPVILNEILDLSSECSFRMLTVQDLKSKSSPGQTGMILVEDEIYRLMKFLDQH